MGERLRTEETTFDLLPRKADEQIGRGAWPLKSDPATLQQT
jgi:hypothetical protein